jgi:hypothetical protein
LRPPSGQSRRDCAYRIVQVADYYCLSWANYHAGRLKAGVDSVGTEVALFGAVVVWVYVDRIVGASGDTGFAAYACFPIEVDNAVRSLEHCRHWTGEDARRFGALIAARHLEVASDRRVLTELDVLHERPGDAQGHFVLRLAGNGACVAANAERIVDDLAPSDSVLICQRPPQKAFGIANDRILKPVLPSDKLGIAKLSGFTVVSTSNPCMSKLHLRSQISTLPSV